MKATPRSPWLARLLSGLVVAAVLVFAPLARAQELPLPPAPPLPVPAAAPGASLPLADDWEGAVRVLRVPGAGSVDTAEAEAATEIFPDADKMWMTVVGTDERPVEAARRGARRWICSGGCDLTLPHEGDAGAGGAQVARDMLQSIKLQTPMQPLPLTIWQPSAESPEGKLLFDPRLMGRRSYEHLCAYPPVSDRVPLGSDVASCPPPRPPEQPTPDSAEMVLGFRWPAVSELARFQYLAITDTCGNARVQPFQRTFTVPVWLVSSGGCEKPDGRVLRVFPGGGWVRVTAFNLDQPAAGNVVSATFRVNVPPLEDIVSAAPPPLLFPDPRMDELMVDCGPQVLKAKPGPGAIPQKAPTPPPGKDGEPTPPLVRPGARLPARGSKTGQPLAHQHLVIAPEPIRRGNCRLELRGQTKRRLIAPLALQVVLRRTDREAQQVLIDERWIVTPTDAIFRLPPRPFDGESRLLLEVYSNPADPAGNVVLLSDAARYTRRELRGTSNQQLMRLIGSVTIHTAPLCGESNFETAEGAGSCVRGYFTVPAMLATLQVTRAPWVERPLITRNVLSAVGLAFAVDSYDPVERSAFPVAFQVGGFVQNLGDDRIGLMSYVGVAPTVPILGAGGNTTSVGLLGGLGITYITRSSGPDEGFKPSAFLSVVVQVGQANPAMAVSEEHTFGTYEPTAASPGGTY